MSDLLSRLEAVPEGNRDFDVELHFLALNPEENPSGLFSYGRNWLGKELWLGAVREGCPHYTTSLDAKLPGENIVKTELCSGEWVAYHDPGEHHPYVKGYGHTEALARRGAALRARDE